MLTVLTFNLTVPVDRLSNCEDPCGARGLPPLHLPQELEAIPRAWLHLTHVAKLSQCLPWSVSPLSPYSFVGGKH